MPMDPMMMLQTLLGVMGPGGISYGGDTMAPAMRPPGGPYNPGPAETPTWMRPLGAPTPGQGPGYASSLGGGQPFDWTQLLGMQGQGTGAPNAPLDANPVRLSNQQLGDYSSVIQQLTAPQAQMASPQTAPGPVAQAQAQMQAKPAGAAPMMAASNSNLAPSVPGGQETILDHIFRTGATGVGGQPIGQQLFNLSMGRLPPALSELLTAQTAEQMGAMGNRFGTDLATATSRGLAQASESQSLAAMQQLLGLGGTTAGFQFARGENALDRALKEYLANQQFDLMNQLLPLLLGGG